MGVLAAVTAVACAIALAVFLGLRSERARLAARHEWAAKIRDRRFRRFEQSAELSPGTFRCSSCGHTKATADQVEMGQVLQAIQIPLEEGAPIPLICDGCYTVIMGEGPVFIDKGA